jgi:hypothetical protein
MPKESPRMLRATRGIERRMFLKAMGAGLTLAAAGRLARVALATPTAAAKRLFVFFMPHGVAPEHYNPRVVGSDLTNFDLDKSNVSILGPLQNYKSYVNVYEGFQYRGAAASHSGIVNCLSGLQIIDDTTQRTTFEQVIGNALKINPLILGACSHLPYGIDTNGKLFWNGSYIDPQKNPAKVADTLFGGTTVVNADVQLRQDLLKLTATEIQTLQSSLSGLTSEQTKLQAHLDAVQGVLSGSGNGSGQSTCTTRPTLPTVEKVRAASAGLVVDPSGVNDYFYQEKNFPMILQAQLELVTQALICNAAQIIGLMPMFATCDFDFSFAGAPGSHHSGLSHTSPQAVSTAQYNSLVSIDNYDPTPRKAFATAQRWFAQQLVDNVVSVLATTDDPTSPGSMVLDNTVIYWMSEIGDGQNHTRLSEIEYPQVPTNLPLVTIGKCGGALKTGQVVRSQITSPDTAATSNRPATDIYLTLAKAMGAATVSFPDTTGVITEALS